MLNNLEKKAKMLASQTREVLGLSHSVPIEDIFKLLEGEGIYVFKKPFNSTQISAIYRKQKDSCLIIINSARTLGHQIFSAAHELYHYRYNKELTAKICKVDVIDTKDKEEIMADLFASHFLMPDDGVIKLAESRKNRNGKLDVTDILFIQQYFNVSYKAMIRKLYELGYIEDANCYLKISVIKLAEKLGYDTRIYQPTNDYYCSKGYIELVVDAYESNLISQKRANEYLSDVGLSFDSIAVETNEGECVYE